jgi:hypothetical protein
LKRNKKKCWGYKNRTKSPMRKPYVQARNTHKMAQEDRIINCPAKTPPDNLTIISRERT